MDERVVGLLYGQRALVVGSLEPMAFTGTLLHSRAARDARYYDRLVSTAAMFDAVIRGSRDQADHALYTSCVRPLDADELEAFHDLGAVR